MPKKPKQRLIAERGPFTMYLDEKGLYHFDKKHPGGVPRVDLPTLAILILETHEKETRKHAPLGKRDDLKKVK